MATLQSPVPDPFQDLDREALESLLATTRAVTRTLERRLAALGSRKGHLRLVGAHDRRVR